MTTPTSEAALTATFADITVSTTGELSLLTTAGHFRRTGAGVWDLVGARPDRARDWRQWMYDLHTGRLFGRLGSSVTEAGAWCLLLLMVTGLVLHRRVGLRKKKA